MKVRVTVVEVSGLGGEGAARYRVRVKLRVELLGKEDKVLVTLVGGGDCPQLAVGDYAEAEIPTPTFAHAREP